MAVTMVVAYHVGLPGAAAGFVGVDVFFVVSGYLITAKLLGETAPRLSTALAGFYARRARRILPALGVVLFAVMILGQALLLPTGEQQDLGKSGVAAALFAANLFFWRRGDDYFADQTAVQPLLHTWSLSVEEQLYLVWPLLVLVVGGTAPQRSPGRGRLVALALAVVTALSFGLWLWLARSDGAAAFFLAPARAWELGAGGLLAAMLGRSRPLSGARALGAMGSMLIPATFALHHLARASPTSTVGLAVLGTLGIIAGGSFAPGSAVNRVLALRALRVTGDISYAWYLWHWPLIALGRALALGERNLWRDGLLALVAYGLAYLSTRYVENPIRNGSVRWLRSARGALVAAVVFSLSMASLCLAIWKRAEGERRASLAPASLDCLGLGLVDRAVDSPCRLARGRDENLFLLGDSHANHWSPAIASFAGALDSSAFERSQSNCPVPLPAFAPNGRFRGAFVSFSDECVAFSHRVLDEVEEAAKHGVPTGVVLSAHWDTYVPAEADDDARSGIEEALAATIEALNAAGVRVLVVGPTPEFRLDPPACVARRNDDSCLLARRRFDDSTRPVARVMERVTAQRPGARYWAPDAVYCDEAYCRPTHDGRLTFRDYGHLSRYGAELAREPLSDDLRWLSTGSLAPINAERPSE